MSAASDRSLPPLGPPPAPELVVCSGLRALVGWDRAAVVVVTDPDRRLPLLGSDALLHRFGDLQQSLMEGPGLDAQEAAVPVLVDDLRATSSPWPLLAASLAAEPLPVRSLAVLPLLPHSEDGRVALRAVGVLVVSRDRVEPFTRSEVHVLAGLAVLLAAMVLHRAASGDLFDGGPAAGDDLPVVLGMLRALLDTGVDEAMALLRTYAFSAGTTIHDVAREVVSGQLELSAVTGSS